MTGKSVRVLHDGGWIHPGGGARVAKELAKALDAPITVGHTETPEFWLDDPDVDAEIAFNHELHDGLAAKVIDRPALRPAAELRLGQLFDSLDPAEDIIVSSGTPAKWFVPRAGQHHVHYCHVPPPRFYGEPAGNPVAWAAKKAGAVLDQHHARFVDKYIANSEFTRARVQKHYRRDSTVLHPPVRTHRFQHQPVNPEPFFVMIGRLVEMKRALTVATAFDRLDARLVMIGDGPLRSKCEAIDGVTVYPDMSDWAVEQTVARAIGGIAFAEHEHCGMTPKEFQAAGKPVVVPDEPNLRNHVIDGETGVIAPASTAGVNDAVRRVQATDWNHEAIQAAAESWSTSQFHATARDLILDTDTAADRSQTIDRSQTTTAAAVPDGGTPNADD